MAKKKGNGEKRNFTSEVGDETGVLKYTAIEVAPEDWEVVRESKNDKGKTASTLISSGHEDQDDALLPLWNGRARLQLRYDQVTQDLDALDREIKALDNVIGSWTPPVVPDT